MTGHHEIRFFPFKMSMGKSGAVASLPTGWKPFGSFQASGNRDDVVYIVARRWVREEP